MPRGSGERELKFTVRYLHFLPVISTCVATKTIGERLFDTALLFCFLSVVG
jgi:hypothetical protein